MTTINHAIRYRCDQHGRHGLDAPCELTHVRTGDIATYRRRLYDVVDMSDSGQIVLRSRASARITDKHVDSSRFEWVADGVWEVR